MKTDTTAYRGKHFEMPLLSSEGLHIVAQERAPLPAIPKESPVIQDLNSTWDLKKFLTPRLPVSLGTLSAEELAEFTKWNAPRVLDLPIKFPGSDFRLPKELAQFSAVVQRIANYEKAINPGCFDEYYCYLTVDQGEVGSARVHEQKAIGDAFFFGRGSQLEAREPKQRCQKKAALQIFSCSLRLRHSYK